jgi:hydroxymethylpyrimidine pyrophosphatase-like HAD family hydrolase
MEVNDKNRSESQNSDNIVPYSPSVRHHVFATDYDGTLAENGKVDGKVVEKLKELKSSGRLLVLDTGREMRFLIEDFPDYKVFDHVVAENGAVLFETGTGKEKLLGEVPDEQLIRALKARGVGPISIGKVIIATWEPQEQAVLQVIKDLGLERQVIFNKGVVMILTSGINKASGLKTLLGQLFYSDHNLVDIGDAENYGTMLELAECGVAVSNALNAVKKIADYTTPGKGGKGVMELIDQLLPVNFYKSVFIKIGKIKRLQFVNIDVT